MRHRPLTVLAVTEGGKSLECATTAAMMARYGVDAVRGAGWCRLELAEPDWLKQARDYKKWKEEADKEEEKGGDSAHLGAPEPNTEP